jgi:hypothetical protein
MESISEDDPPIVFRSGKKRKAYRQRGHDEPTDAQTPSNPVATDNNQNGEHSDDAESASVTDVLRRRRRARLDGVKFKIDTPPKTVDAAAEPGEQSLVPEAPAPTGGISKRFAPQTGLVGELVNRHM